jgi:hypothetical protein
VGQKKREVRGKARRFAFVVFVFFIWAHAAAVGAAILEFGDRSTEWCGGEWCVFMLGSAARGVSGELSNDLMAECVSVRGGDWCCDSARDRSGASDG